MNLREINFSFGGLHCLRDFGCIYAEKGGHTITPPATRNIYEIAGASGTIAFPGVTHGTHAFDGALYFLRDPPDQQAAQEYLRKIGAWLAGGRQRLIFDYEPLRFYLAEMNDESKWSFANWIGGGLDVSFEAQPYAYNVRENTASATLTGASAAIDLTVDTGEDAPLKLAIENTGTATITGATVSARGKSAAFTGMSLTPGQTLTIDMEPPIGASIGAITNALPYATAFDFIALAAGKTSISVGLTYGSGTKGATITASARGRFL